MAELTLALADAVTIGESRSNQDQPKKTDALTIGETLDLRTVLNLANTAGHLPRPLHAQFIYQRMTAAFVQ